MDGNDACRSVLFHRRRDPHRSAMNAPLARNGRTNERTCDVVAWLLSLIHGFTHFFHFFKEIADGEDVHKWTYVP